MPKNKTYDDYLFEQGYAKTTIASYLNAKSRFTEWCDIKEYDLVLIDYKSCLDYIKEIQRPHKGKVISKRSVSHHIGALKVYFNYQIDENHRGDNPMQNINIRGVRRGINQNILEFEELEDLFYSYPTQNIEPPNCPHVATRNKVIVGLMVYQGLGAEALMSLKVDHVHIKKQLVYIPSTRRTNSRELELTSQQMFSLVQFLEEDRLLLQDKIGCYTGALFPRNSERPDVLLYTLFKRLRRLNYKVKDAKQIRASVITHWLKLYNIREVQYMIGHRYISSTEKYLQNDIGNLQEVIDMAHPIH